MQIKIIFPSLKVIILLASTVILSVLSAEVFSSVEKTQNTIRLAISKSLAETGLMTALIQRFREKNPQINFEVSDAGSLEILNYVRNDKADLVISHYAAEEKRLLVEGYISKRTQLFFSKYALFGPPGDKLGLAQKKSIVDVLQTIAEEEAPFMVASPKGGTYRKNEELWALAGIHPDWPDFQYTILNSTATLKQAAQLDAYTISDMGAYLSNKNMLSNKITPLYQNDLALQNTYSILIVKEKEESRRLRYKDANKFYDYLISDQGQNEIREIAKLIFNDTIIVPAAEFDLGLASLHSENKLKNDKRTLVIVITILTILLAAIIFLFYLYHQFQKSEKNRLQGETRYRDLVETTPDWVWELDKDYKFSYVSPRISQLLGYLADDLLGLNFLDLISDKENKFLNVLHKEKQFANLECLRIHKNGNVVLTEISAVPILSKNNIFIGYRGIERDITERKSVEKENLRLQREIEQSNKMKSLGQLTGGIAHDFNNILAAIVGFAGLALNKSEKLEDEALTNYISQINKAGLRAKDLISRMLDFSRIDNTIDDSVDIASLIEDELIMLRSMLPTSIEIKTDLEKALPAASLTATQLQQIVMNLAINARDAMCGQGVLSIRLHWLKNVDAECIVSHKHVSGSWIALSISDTGEGIDVERIKDIFNPFFTTKEVGKGTGLGLSVVYGIMQNHGGFILLNSEPAAGSTFTLLFHPSEKSQPEEIKSEIDVDGIIEGKGQVVLVVDDDLAVGEYLGELLKNYNYRTTVVDSAIKALDVFKENPQKFDLLITDQTMPNMTGIELVKKIRMTHPNLAIIICSGFSEQLDDKMLIAMDAYYLKKPINSEKLLIKVAELLASV
jgi:PAS domain S-box-containing protein